MTARAAFCIVALALTAATGAHAQSAESAPISTASASASPPAAEGAAAPLPVDAYPADPAAPPGPDGKIHGVVSVGVGTGGYRQAGIEAAGPLPNGGDFAIAVGDTQIDGAPSRRHRPPLPPGN